MNIHPHMNICLLHEYTFTSTIVYAYLHMRTSIQTHWYIQAKYFPPFFPSIFPIVYNIGHACNLLLYMLMQNLQTCKSFIDYFIHNLSYTYPNHMIFDSRQNRHIGLLHIKISQYPKLYLIYTINLSLTLFLHIDKLDISFFVTHNSKNVHPKCRDIL